MKLFLGWFAFTILYIVSTIYVRWESNIVADQATWEPFTRGEYLTFYLMLCVLGFIDA